MYMYIIEYVSELPRYYIGGHFCSGVKDSYGCVKTLYVSVLTLFYTLNIYTIYGSRWLVVK